MEYARNVLGIADADSAEHGSGSQNLVVVPVACALPARAAGAPALSGQDAVRLVRGSRLHAIYGQDEVREEYFCNYEVNPEFQERMQRAGLRISARGPRGEVRAVEIPDLPFFHATLFQPQLSSRAEAPHPVMLAFVEAAGELARHRAARAGGAV